MELALQYWCTMPLYAGSTTTRDFIANSLARLLANPHEADTLRENPALMHSAIEELQQVEGPVRSLARVARDDLTIDELKIPRSALVYLHLDQAKRDPTGFAQAERVDFARNANPHLAFGLGATYCLGSRLPRLETRTVLQMLLPRCSRMKLVAKPE